MDIRKIRREGLRVWHQVTDRTRAPFDLIMRWDHDRRFPRQVQIFNGDRQPGEKVALFLIYQPDGMARSIRVTCETLVAKGYSVLLVSNTPLSQAERAELAPLCWKIAVRPNFGYDFGGYRDGLRLLREAGLRPEWLLILNDSIWFPMSSDSRLLDRMETGGAAFDAPVYIQKDDRGPTNRHFQSFFLLIRRDAQESAAFVDYWQNLRVSSKKRTVLKHGEKGFSQAMFRAGFGGKNPPVHRALFHALEGQPDAFLRKTLDYASYADPALLSEAQTLLSEDIASPGWRERTLDHMRRALSRHSPVGLFVYASTLLLDFDFLKKRSFSDVFDGMRWQYVRAVRNGDLPAPHPDVLAEVLESKMDGSMTPDPAARTRA